MVFDSRAYVHEADKAALNALKAIPGFQQLVKGFMKIFSERQYRIVNLSSNIRISEKQFPKYYEMLPPICEKLGIDVPDLYLCLNDNPNAYTAGDEKPFIVMTSGLINKMPEELLPTVLAHECGHIACHHQLYSTMGRIVLSGASTAASTFLPMGGLLTVPMQVAFYYWMRCSEFSADRAAVLCDGTADKMSTACMYFAGYDSRFPVEPNKEEFMKQAQEYREIVKNNGWDKTLEFMYMANASHPLTAVRALECEEWAKTELCRGLLEGRVIVRKKGEAANEENRSGKRSNGADLKTAAEAQAEVFREMSRNASATVTDVADTSPAADETNSMSSVKEEKPAEVSGAASAVTETQSVAAGSETPVNTVKPEARKDTIPWYKDTKLTAKNAEIAKETQKICREGVYQYIGKPLKLPEHDFSAGELFAPEDGAYFIQKGIAEYQKEMSCKIEVTNEDSYQAAHRYSNPFVMNFANAVHPGGGFLIGAPAQEESLCRNSTLYMSLTSRTASPMYRFNKFKPLASDYMLLSPEVCVFRDAHGNLLEEPYMVSVLTTPAPNRKKEAANVAAEAIDETMKRRIKIMLHIAMNKGYKNLILGAWGCGAFGHDPAVVSEYFRSILIDEGYQECFKNICFAVYGPEDSANYTVFRDAFSRV